MKLAVQLLTVTYFLTCVTCQGNNTNETEALEFLTLYNENATTITNAYKRVEWLILEYNEQSDRDLLRKYAPTRAAFMRDMRRRALSFDASAMCSDIQRQLSKVKNIGIAAQSDEIKAEQLSEYMADMESTVFNGQYCDDTGDCGHVVPSLFTPDGGQKFLSQLWASWRNNTGRLIKDLFTRYVDLSNEAVQLTGYRYLGEQWRSRYQSDTFREQVSELYERLRPLYEQVHAHVRKVLDGQKKNKKPFPKTGQIPACILGNHMADEWSHVYADVEPFRRQGFGWTRVKNYYPEPFELLHLVENFFVSLRFHRMNRAFWKQSIKFDPIQVQTGTWRGSAWDFLDQKDFRIAITPFVSHAQLIEGFNLMARIYYAKQFKNQPVIYREGANDAFMDAVGGAFELSVRNLKYFYNISLMKRGPRPYKQKINFLMWVAMEEVSFLPFAYLVDVWRWSVFNGSTTPENYNKEWWRLRCAIQGVSPPVTRLADDFDPGSFYDIAANKPYIKHFLSTILQFQIYKALCHEAKHRGPIHECNLQGSIAAGRKLRAMMALGSSLPWQTALKRLTGHSRIEADAMLEYFQPLFLYLKKKNGRKFGWKPNCDKKVKIYG